MTEEKHYICLTLEKPLERNPLVSFMPDKYPVEAELQGLQDLEPVDTACGKQQMRVLLLNAHQLAFYIRSGLAVAICPRCMEHPDVALALLREL